MEEVLFNTGAVDRVKLVLGTSGWLLWDGNGGRESPFKLLSKGVGRSAQGGRVGNAEALRYSFPNGLSRVWY
jgi:hypothetical protein